MRRTRSIQLDNNNLNQTELNDILTQFKKQDSRSSGYIGKMEVYDILKDLRVLDNEKLIARFNKELSEFNDKFFEVKQVIDLYSKLRQYQFRLYEEQESIAQEYIDTFVALGGHMDKTGYVMKSDIIETVQKEFGLNFDLEGFLGDFQGTQLDFDEFCQLFESIGEENL